MQTERNAKSERAIYLWFLLPFVLSINMIAFGNCYLQSWNNFLTPTIIAAIYFSFMYFVFSLLAGTFRKGFPEESKLVRRVSLMLISFYLMNVLMSYGIYAIFEKVTYVNCAPKQDMLWWVIGFSILTSTVLTVVNEAALGWDKWKLSVVETEKLSHEYQRTRLLGLKGQVNPHFLFNCFNSLSSLINEDEEAAEKFLNEMTRVHRYMLRTDDEHLVKVENELAFSRSYLYLIKMRFGDSIRVELDASSPGRPAYIPPLSMQAILENIIYNNAVSKTDPLYIRIGLNEGHLEVLNSVHPKTGVNRSESEEGLDNLVKKYQLLNVPPVIIEESVSERLIRLPLINNKEVKL